jgi:hypothetical protein
VGYAIVAIVSLILGIVAGTFLGFFHMYRVAPKEFLTYKEKNAWSLYQYMRGGSSIDRLKKRINLLRSTKQ